ANVSLRGLRHPARARARASGGGPTVEGNRAPPDRELATEAVLLPPCRRPRHRDRAREEPPRRPLRVPSVARRARSADPARPHAQGLSRVRADQGQPWAGRLRGHARTCSAATGGGRLGPRTVSVAVPWVHGRRVPGREPAPANA